DITNIVASFLEENKIENSDTLPKKGNFADTDTVEIVSKNNSLDKEDFVDVEENINIGH
ncbi:25855_t:CDS:1, partial [Gigaspora rosea]